MSESEGRRVVVMGVSSCGKTEVGQRLATALGGRFLDGDDYHAPESVAKMSRGEPLTDDDRAGWLAKLAELIGAARAQGETLVIGCSALKRRYRDTLRRGDDGLTFVHLAGSRELLLQRIQSRQAHFFKGEAMLDSQLETLEAPGEDEAVTVDIAGTMDQVVNEAVLKLEKRALRGEF
ncbi:gluconokinase [Salinicola rhizosphaerae]|uniref:Gluconokinase n=1 Tax=Salinicola rhizosphaerae TaxID=1443141 RepID=A0ABQ3DY74_9GAMM|nr:gluconokinase [Salinicola rhizosphaerae]GHB16473.1 gluconokinase [Salinicola rhizosphaerae]